MLYHTESCGCSCHRDPSQLCLACMKEDGVEPVGKIDWPNPVFYGWLYNEHPGHAQEYRERWEAAYRARGWGSPFAV